LLWLLPVLLAAPVTMAWLSWTSRTRRPVEVAQSVEAYERFRAALARPVTPPRD
jgi:hypothetical protein